jgi:hypothetical protein
MRGINARELKTDEQIWESLLEDNRSDRMMMMYLKNIPAPQNQYGKL